MTEKEKPWIKAVYKNFPSKIEYWTQKLPLEELDSNIRNNYTLTLYENYPSDLIKYKLLGKEFGGVEAYKNNENSYWFWVNL